MDEATLRMMYTDQLMTDGEIASVFSVNQTTVSRLRKKFGIPSLGKTTRIERSIPPLTQTQHSLLVGSLLGDGYLSPTSDESARYCEGHSEAQQDYLQWKSVIMGPYVSTVVRTEKRVGDKVFVGSQICGVSCRQLRPLYDLFYPAPNRKRKFPKSLPDIFDPLALAIWYMDDGSLMNRYHPRITFGLDDDSLDHALQALNTLGLDARVHSHPTDNTRTLTFPAQDRKFFDVVYPHVPTCMMHKLPKQDTARRLSLQRGKQTDIKTLYAGGLSQAKVAFLTGVSINTVRRRLAGAVRRPGPHADKLSTQAASALTDALNGDVEAILGVLRRTGFPYPPALSDEAWERGLQLLKGTRIRLVGDVLTPWTNIGCSLCTPYFPNRYEARSRGAVSSFEAWYDDAKLRKAIEFQLKVGDPTYPHRVLRAVTMQHRTPSVFRPTVAKWIYDTYCSVGGRVWDPCAGYGGRLLGAWAADVSYVGTDVEVRTIDGCRSMAERLGYVAELQCVPAEEFDPGDVDLVFTSPPYFNREQYSDSSKQSWVKYTTSDTWVDGFLLPVLRMASMRSPRTVMNVADVRQGRKLIPLVQLTIDVAQRVGLNLKAHLKMPLARLNRKEAYESILIFER